MGHFAILLDLDSEMAKISMELRRKKSVSVWLVCKVLVMKTKVAKNEGFQSRRGAPTKEPNGRTEILEGKGWNLK